MTSLATYGPAIAATTERLRSVIADADPATIVTTRHPRAARTGVTGTSANLFLYQDQLTRYRDGADPTGGERVVGAELRYLVSVYPADEVEVDAASHRAFGAARAALESSPVVTVSLASGATLSAQLSSSSLTLSDLTSLWLASGTPLRLSFGIAVRISLPVSRGPAT